MNTPDELPRSLQSSWRAFLDTYEPLRADLYRYCRHLTRSPWDAEDLSQDALARAFVTLAQLGSAPPHARAWLFRVASNLWIDRVRRRQRELPREAEGHDEALGHGQQATREAAGTLLSQLSAQERAAVLLKDVFDFSLEEAAETLGTSVGAIKSALHRARGKLVEPASEPSLAPAPALLDAFCAAFNAGDIDKLTALLLDSVSVEVVGLTTQYGPDAARRTVLYGMLFGVQHMLESGGIAGIDAQLFEGALPTPPRVELRAHRGAWLLLHWYAHRDGEAVRAITRVEPDGERVARIQNYFYSPELLREVCGELGLPARANGYRGCTPAPAATRG